MKFPWLLFLVTFVADLIQGKDLVVTNGEQVVCIQNKNTTILSPCNHEEADMRMLLHASHAAFQGLISIMIRTVDTDALVLAVMVTEKVLNIQQLLLAFDVRRNFPLYCSSQNKGYYCSAEVTCAANVPCSDRV